MFVALKLSTYIGSLIIRYTYNKRMEKRLIKDGYMNEEHKYDLHQTMGILAQYSILYALPGLNMILESMRLIDEDIFYEIEKEKRRGSYLLNFCLCDMMNYFKTKKEKFSNKKENKNNIDIYYSSKIEEETKKENSEEKKKEKKFSSLSIKEKIKYLKNTKNELETLNDKEIDEKEDKPKSLKK